MTHVSRKKLEAQVDHLLNNLLTITSTKQLSSKDNIRTMNVLFTPTEVNMIKKRLGIIYLLNEGLDTENISKLTKTTRQTIARLRLQLLEVNSEDKKYFLNL